MVHALDPARDREIHRAVDRRTRGDCLHHGRRRDCAIASDHEVFGERDEIAAKSSSGAVAEIANNIGDGDCVASGRTGRRGDGLHDEIRLAWRDRC